MYIVLSGIFTALFILDKQVDFMPETTKIIDINIFIQIAIWNFSVLS